MGNGCVLVCDENYKNSSIKSNKGYTCIPKECEDRKPWTNKTCSAREDFFNEIGESNVECYYSKIEDDEIGKCVTKEKCDDDYPGVFILFHLLLFIIYIFLVISFNNE